MKTMRLPQWAILFCLLLIPSAYAADYLGHQLDGQVLTVRTDEGNVQLTAWHSEAFAVHYQPTGVKQLPSFALAGKPESVMVSLTDKGEGLVFNAGDIQAHVRKAPLRVRFYRGTDYIGGEERGLFNYDGLRGFRFALQDDEKLLGTGERVVGMDRRGERLPLYNRASYGYGDNRTEQMYYSVPVVMSSHKYMLVFDNSASGWVDLGKSESDVLQFEASGGRTAYLFTAADSFEDLLLNYVRMTGKQPLPPRWALGNVASRFGYRTEQEVRDTIGLFREKQLPVDAIVLDLYWFGTEVKGTMGNLAWHKESFPAPEKMIADLKADGVQTILITEPFVLTSSDRWQEAVDANALAKNLGDEDKRFDFYFGNTGLIDVFNPVAQDWFWSVYAGLNEQGVGGWWGDLGEPEVHPYDAIHTLADGTKASADEVHNAYGHQWAAMLAERLQQADPDTRHFIMMRSGFAGSQRYGMVPWTGDVSRSWSGLKPQVELSLQMGLTGLAWTHSDLGGFAGGEVFDQEMYVRWLQYGVFQPVFRPHAQDNIAPEPVFHDERTIQLLRPYLNLRYQLLPYLYSMAFENSQTGLPLMRPLFFDDLKQLENAQSYMWGDAFLVTPVTAAGVSEVTVQAPAGIWFNFWNDTRYQGGQALTLASPLEQLPVLVKAGSFVPMVKAVATTKDYSSAELILHYYHDASVKNAAYQMYEDDGKTAGAYDKGLYELLNISASVSDELVIELARDMPSAYQGAPTQRQITLLVHGVEHQPKQITIGQQDAKQWAYDSQKRLLTIGFSWDHQAQRVRIK